MMCANERKIEQNINENKKRIEKDSRLDGQIIMQRTIHLKNEYVCTQVKLLF